MNSSCPLKFQIAYTFVLIQFLDLKKQINIVKGVQIEKQKLIYKGKIMDDKTILSDVGVKDEDVIVLMNLIQKK